MKRYERILVCIQRPEHASGMLAYVGAIARLAESKEIHLLHVSDEKAHGAQDAPTVATSVPEMSADTLRALATEGFKEYGSDLCRCEVVQGPPLLEVLRFAHDRDVDLIVIGRHDRGSGDADDEALLARRITRKSTCSVLVLPDEGQIKADTVLVPVRNSDCSANALDVACGIAVATDATVIACDVYQVHTGYSRVGTTLEEHEALLEAAARRECDKLIKRVDTRNVDVRCLCAPDLHGKPVPVILEAIDSVSADLIVIGARGRTGAAGVLLGTVTEQLIRSGPLPVLAVKKKGECLGILRALLTLTGEG